MAEPTSLDQRRAVQGWKDLAAVKKEGLLNEYYSLIRGFPSMVHAIGIGQAVAFLMANATKQKGKPSPHSLLLDQLTRWLLEAPNVPWPKGVQQKPKSAVEDRLLESLLDIDSPTWRRADEEAVAYTSWLKRYAEALHETSPNETPAAGASDAHPQQGTRRGRADR